MADKLVAALNDKRNLTGIKKALIFTEGKNTLKNYGVFVFKFWGLTVFGSSGLRFIGLCFRDTRIPVHDGQ